jgi:hypothetical protein
MTGTSSVCQFYDSPRQLICFWKTFFRVREADLLKSSETVPMVCQDNPDRITIHKQTDTLFYIHCDNKVRYR